MPEPAHENDSMGPLSWHKLPARSQQRSQPIAPRAVEHLIRRFLLEDFTAIHEHDAVRDTTRETHFTSHADHGHAGVRQVHDERSAVAGGIVTISLGVAVAMPNVGDECAALILCADQSLYMAKDAGRGQVRALQI